MKNKFNKEKISSMTLKQFEKIVKGYSQEEYKKLSDSDIKKLFEEITGKKTKIKEENKDG